MHEHRLLFIAFSLVLVCNYEVDSVDTVSQDQNEGKIREDLDIKSTKDTQRQLNSDSKPVKMDIVGLGGHNHGHLHHPNKVRGYIYLVYKMK